MRAYAVVGLLLLVCAASPAAAQPGSMAGRVRGPGGVPFRGAQVLIDDSVRAVSDDSGRFMVAPVAKGVHRIMVRAIGFGPQQNLFHVDMGEKLVREFTLATNLDTLAAVTIVGARGERIPLRLQGFEDRRVRGQGRFIDQTLLEKRSDRLAIVLRQLPAVAIKRGIGSMEHAVNTRSGCFVNIYLDGTLILGPPPLDLNTLPPAMLHGIEYYASGATIPAAYHRIGFERCGVMLLWTK